MEEEIDTTPLLGLRLLRLLRDAQKSDSSDPFVTLEQIIDYCRAMLIEPNATLAWLSRILETGLCLSYDPTVTAIAEAGKIELSPAGFQHLRWGTRDSDYAQAMLEVTPLADRASFEELSDLTRRPHRDVWRDELEGFINYLVAEDSKFCKVPEHDAYRTQKQLTLELRRLLPPIYDDRSASKSAKSYSPREWNNHAV